MKIRPVVAELFHADRRTDMTKLIDSFRNFAKAPKNVSYLAITYVVLRTALHFQHPLQRHWKYIYEGWNFNSGNYLFTTDTK